MKYLPNISIREGMQIGVSLGAAVGIFMIGTFLASALSRGFVGNMTNDGGAWIVAVTPDFRNTKHKYVEAAGVKPVASQQHVIDVDTAQALEATRWMVFQELQETIKNSLPAAVAGTVSPGDRNMESMQVLASKTGVSTFFTDREMAYHELKDKLDKMIGTRLQDQVPENLGNSNEKEPPEEYLRRSADKNAATVLAVTNGEVVKNLNQSVRYMILFPLGVDSVTEIAQTEHAPYKPSAALDFTRYFTRISWSSADE